MAATNYTMTIAQIAKAYNVDARAIGRQIDKGVIQRVGGLLDPEQVEASWGKLHRARKPDQKSREGQRSATARIGAVISKLRLAQDRFETARERYVERDEAIRIAGEDAEFIRAMLRSAPTRNAAAFAATLGIEQRLARRILTRFIAQVIVEIGDLRAEAIRAAEAA